MIASVVSRQFIEVFFFFFNDTATTEIYTLSLHDALPSSARNAARSSVAACPAPGHTRQTNTIAAAIGVSFAMDRLSKVRRLHGWRQCNAGSRRSSPVRRAMAERETGRRVAGSTRRAGRLACGTSYRFEPARSLARGPCRPLPQARAHTIGRPGKTDWTWPGHPAIYRTRSGESTRASPHRPVRPAARARGTRRASRHTDGRARIGPVPHPEYSLYDGALRPGAGRAAKLVRFHGPAPPALPGGARGC